MADDVASVQLFPNLTISAQGIISVSFLDSSYSNGDARENSIQFFNCF
jgi:hypothetical protein